MQFLRNMGIFHLKILKFQKKHSVKILKFYNSRKIIGHSRKSKFIPSCVMYYHAATQREKSSLPNQ
ncbi:hypothetical protein J41TS12_03190 [Paenibacillus antibioticophila]|uniref:Uncharacterized protein n=1 Tax=Paenibacillus antibioticophila TaxID=1274374 RepID=A0A920CF39_9BACL|nr:hypothetical protein J41TS12_03190 [Paenibacillus antibioticophila]